LKDVYNLLEDDGILVFQVAGIRPHWQYEDLIWYALKSLLTLELKLIGKESRLRLIRGLFMNKYVFPGADASARSTGLLEDSKTLDSRLPTSMFSVYTVRRPILFIAV